MENKKENAVERLLKSYRRFYNITRFDGGISPPLEEGRNLREAVKLSPSGKMKETVLPLSANIMKNRPALISQIQ